jgi:ABC-type transport system substrate-binding protein
MTSIFTFPGVVAQPETSSDNWVGPYLDKIQYIFVNGTNPNDWYDEYRSQIQALIDGEIDVMTTQAHDPEDVEALGTAANVELVKFWRSAAYDAKINCDRWPLNISDVRKALHLAIDKNAMSAIQGLRPHDSPIISPLPLSIELEMEHHYYEAEVEEGNVILDSLGFLDIDSDGWREGPGGVEIPPINIEFYRGIGSGPLNEDNANLIADAFHNLNIDAYSTRLFNVPARMSSYDFDIFLYAMIGHDLTLDSWIRWMLSRPDWSNATFEALANVALHSVDYDEVAQAFKEMQYIWVEDAPHIILMQLPLYSGYRTDLFDGIVEHPSYGPHSFFTGLNAHNASEGSTGGTIRYGTTGGWSSDTEVIRLPSRTCGIDVSNWFHVKSHMEMMHDSLAMIDPELNVVNWLAEECTIETHDDDATIPEGNTRILVNLVQNAKFSDGTLLTAEDVAYSINWFLENNDLEFDIRDISTLFATSPFQVELQFTTESFWHWYKVCFIPILPKHAPTQYEPDSPGSNTYEPKEFNEDLVVSGPFMASEWRLGEYIEIVQNPYYWRKPMINTTTTTTTTPITGGDLMLPIIAGVAGAATVIVIGGFVVLKKID